jgi:hypothetical protein
MYIVDALAAEEGSATPATRVSARCGSYHRSLLNLRPQGTLGYLQWCLAKLQGEHFGYLAGSFSSYVSACPNLEAHFGPNNREVLYSMNARRAPASLVADATLSVCQWVLGWAGPSADPNERHCIRGQHSGSSFAVFPTDAPGSSKHEQPSHRALTPRGCLCRSPRSRLRACVTLRAPASTARVQGLTYKSWFKIPTSWLHGPRTTPCGPCQG